MTRKVVTALLIALCLSLISSPALAGDYRDANDASGPLDMKRLKSSWERVGGSTTYDFKILMFKSWRPNVLDRLGSYILLHLDTRGDKQADYFATFARNGREVVAELYKKRPRRFVADLSVAKLARGVVVWIPRGQLSQQKRISWQVVSSSGGISSSDQAPDRGWHRI